MSINVMEENILYIDCPGLTQAYIVCVVLPVFLQEIIQAIMIFTPLTAGQGYGVCARGFRS
jgi:hypothetical protein